MHVVDGLEEGQDGTVVGDAAPAHVVALHSVQEGGHGVLQGLQELLVVLLRLAVLVLLLEKANSMSFTCQLHTERLNQTADVCSVRCAIPNY